MTLRERLFDGSTDRAVSPVIGVILMVGITVVLAAVTGAFVLDMANSTGETSPRASLSVSADDPDSITIEHTGGDGLNSSETRLIVEAGGTTTFDANGSDVLSVGEEATITLTASDDTVAWGTNSTTYTTTGDADTFASGDEVTITIIDTTTQQQIYETTVTA
ncbi:MAG: type IV pilin [Halobacteriales archaeon]|jgi:flagellin-like protein